MKDRLSILEAVLYVWDLWRVWLCNTRSRAFFVASFLNKFLLDLKHERDLLQAGAPERGTAGACTGRFQAPPRLSLAAFPPFMTCLRRNC